MGQAIRELMTSDVVALDASTSVQEAARRMRDENIGDVLVTKNGRLCGIVTDRDIVVRCVAEGRDASEPIGALCSQQLVTLTPESDVSDAIRLMEERAIRRLPVVDGDEPVGIVSIGDLAIARDRDSALGQISAAPPTR